MSEVLGDAEPPSNDEQPPFEDLDGRYDDYGADDFDDAEPGPIRRIVVAVATAEALAIGAVIIATASLLDLPTVNIVTSSLSVSRSFSPVFSDRVNAAGQLVVAVVGGLLALAARRSQPPGGHGQSSPAWVGHASGGALIVGAVSAALAIVAFLVAGTAHQPHDGGQIFSGATQTVGPGPVLPFDENSSPASVFIDPSSGAIVRINPAPQN